MTDLDFTDLGLDRDGVQSRNRSLYAGERVHHETTLHWVVLVQPAVVTVALFAVAGVAARSNPQAAGWVVLAAVGYALAAFVNWRFDYYTITDSRLIHVTGFKPINRRAASTPLRALTGYITSQKLAGSVLGYATFIVEDPGQQQAITFMRYIPHPAEVDEILARLIYQPR